MTNTSAQKGKNNPMRSDGFTIYPQSVAFADNQKMPRHVNDLPQPTGFSPIPLSVGMVVEDENGRKGLVIGPSKWWGQGVLVAWERGLNRDQIDPSRLSNYFINGLVIDRGPRIVATELHRTTFVDREVLKERAKVKRLGLFWTAVVGCAAFLPEIIDTVVTFVRGLS